MPCLPMMREVDFCEAKRRRERKRSITPQSAAADSSPDKGSRPENTRLRVADDSCVAGRPIKSALVRSQYRIGLCPKMKYPPLCGGIIIVYERIENALSNPSEQKESTTLRGYSLFLAKSNQTEQNRGKSK